MNLTYDFVLYCTDRFGEKIKFQNSIQDFVGLFYGSKNLQSRQ